MVNAVAIRAQMTLDDIADHVAQHGLQILGVTSDDETLVLLGPSPQFWGVFSASSEYQDGTPDPIDRWTTRVFAALAATVGARAILPYDGPPYAPFLTWAENSGHAWSSPVGMLVHSEHGLMVSYRGALAFDNPLIDQPTATRPCDTCSGKPCATACPIGALTPSGYDVDACRAYIKTNAGADCLNKGCAVRRICPISKGAQRSEAQSALHMRAFAGVE